MNNLMSIYSLIIQLWYLTVRFGLFGLSYYLLHIIGHELQRVLLTSGRGGGVADHVFFLNHYSVFIRKMTIELLRIPIFTF